MPIRVALNHKTRYLYDRPVTLGPHVVRLRPAPHCRTPILTYGLKITPGDHFLNWQQDPFSNHQARLVFTKPTRELLVEVDLVAEMLAVNPFDFFVEDYAEKHPFRYEPTLATGLGPYLELVAPGQRMAALIDHIRSRFVHSDSRTIDIVVQANQEVQRGLSYDRRTEQGVFSPDETLDRGHGSCRDFAWLLVQTLRHLGYASRFVSGYSIQLADQADAPHGASTADSTDLHAWTEVYLPGAGWIGLDPTSGMMAGEGYIPLACTSVPAAAAPITGSYGWDERQGASKITETFDHEMTITRLAQ